MNYSLGRRYCLGQHTSSPGPGAELFQPEPGGWGWGMRSHSLSPLSGGIWKDFCNCKTCRSREKFGN